MGHRITRTSLTNNTTNWLKAGIQNWLAEIVTAHGHYLLYRPPYHPELQPIELIWARIKNAVAQDPADNAADLHDKVREQLAAVNSTAWTSVYKYTQKYEDRYTASMATVPLIDEDTACDEDGGDAGSDSDTDSNK
ncbi:unnamed protein product [Phytophthora fragariaefolia]|uniref:Unnamed protein product n=1 Tax=Phytophthora fragariaefolia TaxID=1490495 RepID=A0A9W6YEU2_9STRA|nr:unnamed protein product [Phytophthora fragariaefolia]